LELRGGERLSPVEVDHMLENDPCSEAVDAGDTPAHLGAAVPPPRRDPNDLDHTRAGIDEFLDLKDGSSKAAVNSPMQRRSPSWPR
jgi:hypothetical protein